MAEMLHQLLLVHATAMDVPPHNRPVLLPVAPPTEQQDGVTISGSTGTPAFDMDRPTPDSVHEVYRNPERQPRYSDYTMLKE
eukprot:3579172-Amphidinium_carterae.2